MTSLNDRIAQFIVDRFPNDGLPVELLCVDQNGTYAVPFACRRAEGSWRNSKTNELIEAEVAGWRPSRRKSPALAQSPSATYLIRTAMTDALEKRLIEALTKVDAHGDVAPADVQDPMTMVLRQRAIQADLMRRDDSRGHYASR